MAQMENLPCEHEDLSKKVKEVERSCTSITSLLGLEGSDTGTYQGDSALTRGNFEVQQKLDGE